MTSSILCKNGISVTLRVLSMFLTMLPFSKTGGSCCWYLDHCSLSVPKLVSFSNMEYYFQQLTYHDSKVTKCFIWPSQMQCSSFFISNWGKQNDPTISGFQQNEKCLLSYPQDCMGGVTETQNCVGGKGCAPFKPPSTGRHPIKNSLRTLYLGQRAAEKPSTFLAIFLGLPQKLITNIVSASQS